jgi:hypothetical protein
MNLQANILPMPDIRIISSGEEEKQWGNRGKHQIWGCTTCFAGRTPPNLVFMNEIAISGYNLADSQWKKNNFLIN